MAPLKKNIDVHEAAAFGVDGIDEWLDRVLIYLRAIGGEERKLEVDRIGRRNSRQQQGASGHDW